MGEEKLTKELVAELERQMKRRLAELNQELEEDEETFEETMPADSKESISQRAELDIVDADNLRDTEEINDIKQALQNIHTGEYGRCRACHGEIAVARLKVMPQALLCVPCQAKQE